MSDKSQNDVSSEREERFLDQLVSRAMDQSSEEISRPSDEVILAFLQGEVTEEQREQVQEALLKSAPFRDELAEMARDQERLEQVEAKKAYSAAETGRVPDRQSFLEKHRSTVPVPSPMPEPTPTIWQKLTGFLTPTRTTIALAVATAAVVVGVFLSRDGLPPRSHLPMAVARSVDWNLTRDLFTPIDLRGDEDKEILKPTERIAAVAGFQRAVIWENDTFTLAKETRPPSLSPEARAVLVHFVDEDNRRKQEFLAEIPSEAIQPRTWILALPTLSVSAVDMASDSLRLRWQAELGDSGCVTIVFKIGDQYGATKGMTFRYPPNP